MLFGDSKNNMFRVFELLHVIYVIDEDRYYFLYDCVIYIFSREFTMQFTIEENSQHTSIHIYFNGRFGIYFKENIDPDG